MRRVIPVVLAALCMLLTPAQGKETTPGPERRSRTLNFSGRERRLGPGPSEAAAPPAPAAPAPARAHSTGPAAPTTPTPPAPTPSLMPSPTENAMTAASSPSAGQPGAFGSLSGTSSGGMPQMIGDMPAPSYLQALQTGTTPRDFPRRSRRPGRRACPTPRSPRWCPPRSAESRSARTSRRSPRTASITPLTTSTTSTTRSTASSMRRSTIRRSSGRFFRAFKRRSLTVKRQSGCESLWTRSRPVRRSPAHSAISAASSSGLAT